jgi:hypothetical protein
MTQAALDMAHTTSVNEISLTGRPEDDRGSGNEIEFELKGIGSPFNERERWIRTAKLDLRDVTSGHADGVCDLLLGQMESDPGGSA